MNTVQAGGGRRYTGHAHFWERALSRRQFLGTSALATGLALGADLWMPAVAQAAAPFVAPQPIPGGIVVGGTLFHVFLPGHAAEPSTITDFHGMIGVAHVSGAGTGINTTTGEQRRLTFDVDNRFMKGTYVGVDGQTHVGTFGFV